MRGRLSVVACAPADFDGFVARTSAALAHDARGIKAVDSMGRILGMVVYERWTENSVMIHLALDYPIAARALLYPAFSYPFKEAGRSILVGIVNASNKKAMHLNLRLGFREVTRLRDGFSAGVDLVIMEMRKENCRYLGTARRQAA